MGPRKEAAMESNEVIGAGDLASLRPYAAIICASQFTTEQLAFFSDHWSQPASPGTRHVALQGYASCTDYWRDWSGSIGENVLRNTPLRRSRTTVLRSSRSKLSSLRVGQGSLRQSSPTAAGPSRQSRPLRTAPPGSPTRPQLKMRVTVRQTTRAPPPSFSGRSRPYLP